MKDVEEQVETGDERTADRVERTRSILTNVRQFPDPVLRMQTHDVTVFDEPLRALADRMVAIMTSARGIGLAAPQIGVLQRVLVHQADEEHDPVVLCNARVIEHGDESETMDEGCLSLGAAGVTVEVERPVRVVVEAVSVDGEPLRLEMGGLEARVVQHEIDHLDGVLIIDRTSPEQRREALRQLRPEPVLGTF
jgi:peptide deformylase